MENNAVIKLDPATIKLLRENASIVYSATGGYKFYFLPFWFGETDSKEYFTANHLGNLPEELRNAIKQMGGDTDEK
jgi:hypothetical protein